MKKPFTLNMKPTEFIAPQNLQNRETGQKIFFRLSPGPPWIIVSVFACILLLNTVFPSLSLMLNDRCNDLLFKLRYTLKGPEPSYRQLLHIDLSDTDLKAIALPLWDRTNMGKLVAILAEAEVKVTGFDMYFEDAGLPEGDRIFSTALKNAGNVILPVDLKPGNTIPGTGTPLYDMEKRSIWQPGRVTDGKPYQGIIQNRSFRLLQESAAGIGHISYMPGLDGIVRRIPLIIKTPGGYIPGLSLSLVCRYLQVSPADVEIIFGKKIILNNARFPYQAKRNITIPIDDRGNILVNVMAPWETDIKDGLKRFSFSRILAANADEKKILKTIIKDNLVLISDNTTRGKDYGTGIFNAVYPYSEIHLNIINSILMENNLYAPAPVEKTGILLILLPVLLFFTHRFRYKGFLISLFSLYPAFLFCNALLFIYFNRYADLVVPFMCFFLSFLAVSGYYFLQERNTRIRLEVTVEANRKIAVLNSALLEQKKQLEEKDKYKTLFIQNITHEFRTPLTLITGPVEHLLDKGIASGETGELLQIINRNSLKLLYLIDQLLELSGLETGKSILKAAAYDIVKFLHDIVINYNKFSLKKEISFKLISRLKEQILFFDFEKMEKVIHNLLINALKFTQPGGEVLITVSHPLKAAQTIGKDADPGSSEPTGECIEIRIKDNGIGIPGNKLSRIFDRFYQADNKATRLYGSTGIGLALVKEYVELHHGRIAVKSEADKGTEFTIYLLPGKAHFKPEELSGHRDNYTGLSKLYFEYAEHHILEKGRVEPGTSDYGSQGSASLNEKILIVEDDADMRHYLVHLLDESYRIFEADNGKTGLAMAAAIKPDLIISDVMMPEMDGSELLAALKADKQTNKIPVIFLTVKTLKDINLRKHKMEPDDYLSKPFTNTELFKRIRNVLKIKHQDEKILEYKTKMEIAEPEHPEYFSRVITTAPCMKKLFRSIESFAGIPEPVLITGESGTGKELIAGALHLASCYTGKYIKVNIAGLDDQMFTDTLFGHAAGAYTGAAKERSGLIAEAKEGSLFMDEIGDLEMQSQVKLLRLLDSGEYFALGSDSIKKARTRIIAATNADLLLKQETRQFRPDLYSRFTYKIHIPPLRERREDIPLLLDFFLEEASRISGKPKPIVPGELITLLTNYTFPGNIRDLRNMVYGAVSSQKKHILSLDVFREYIAKHPGKKQLRNSYVDMGDCISISLAEGILTLKELEQCYIKDVLKRVKGNQTIAANYLGLSGAALSRKIKKSVDKDSPDPGAG